jgi:hypothetical protein
MIKIIKVFAQFVFLVVSSLFFFVLSAVGIGVTGVLVGCSYGFYLVHRHDAVK